MKELYGKCSPCGHVFLVAKLPMPVATAANLMLRAGCAMCGETDRIVIPTAAEILAAGFSESDSEEQSIGTGEAS